MRVGEGVSWYSSTFGLRGLLAISRYRLFGRPKEFSVYPPGAPNPVTVRIKTTDEATYAQILLWGQYAFELPFLPKIIVDAGANVGMASIYFANAYPGATIFAIEPEPANFAMLARNVRRYSAITPLHMALWNKDGEINIGEADPATGANGNWSFVTGERPGVKVRCITISTLMREMGISCVDVLKMDIEGAEIEVFEHSDWLQNVRCFMIELHDRYRPGCSDAVNAVAQGFSKLQRGETTFFLREALPQEKQHG